MAERKQEKTMHRIFVYGTLKRGHRNYHHFLTESKFVQEAKTLPHYRIYDNGSYPCLQEDREKGYAVHGEIFEVDDVTMRRLDQLEGVPYLYKRAVIEVEGVEGPIAGYLYQRSVDRYRECTDGIWK